MKNEKQTQSQADWMIQKFDINDIKDGLTDLGHEVDCFETKSDFIGYLECLANGTCGEDGTADWNQLRSDLIADAETMKNYDREVAEEKLQRFGLHLLKGGK